MSPVSGHIPALLIITLIIIMSSILIRRHNQAFQGCPLFHVWKLLVWFTFNPVPISINPSKESSWLSTEWLRIHRYISSRTKLLHPTDSIFLNTFYFPGQIVNAGVRIKAQLLRPHQQCMSAGKCSPPGVTSCFTPKNMSRPSIMTYNLLCSIQEYHSNM